MAILLLQAAAAEPAESAWPCTPETLAKGAACTFEGGTPVVVDRRKQAAENRQATRKLAAALCAQNATPPGAPATDTPLARMCEKNLVDASLPCVEDLDGPLLDASGRFASNARRCYQVIAAVLQQTHLMAATASSCCRCLAHGPCGVTGERCYLDLAAGSVDTRTQSCMQQACGAKCPGLTVSGDDEADEVPERSAPKTKAIQL